MAFRLRNTPLLSRIGADRADHLRTDIEAATAGWADAALLRVDHRNQVLISDGRVVLGAAGALADAPPEERARLPQTPRQAEQLAQRAAPFPLG